jgi:hypothetical protein
MGIVPGPCRACGKIMLNSHPTGLCIDCRKKSQSRLQPDIRKGLGPCRKCGKIWGAIHVPTGLCINCLKKSQPDIEFPEPLNILFDVLNDPD